MTVVCVYMYSGGTVVTVTGSHLNSVAEPRITLTVITTSNSVILSTNSTSEVLNHHALRILRINYRAFLATQCVCVGLRADNGSAGHGSWVKWVDKCE